MLGKVVITNGSATKALVGVDKFEVTQQEAVLHTSDGQVRKFTLSLAATQSPYAVGEYGITDACLTVDKYGRLELSRNLSLAPLKASAVSSARSVG